MSTQTIGEVIRNFQQAAPVDITALANELGVNVFESYELPAGISGKIAKDELDGGTSGYAITVNASEGKRRKRFTIAHECAHFILHKNLIGDELTEDALLRSDRLPTRIEYEANNFAADLLMPRFLIQRYQAGSHADVKSLSDAFLVSERAMQIRLKYLAGI